MANLQRFGNQSSIFQGRLEVGWLLCLFGNQFSRLIIELTGWPDSFTNIVFLTGILLIINYHNLVHSIFPSFSKLMILVFLYQIILIFNWELSPYKDGSNNNSILFTYFCLALVIASTTNNYTSFDSQKFINLGWWATGLSSFIFCILATHGFQSFDQIIVLPQGSDRLTVSVIAFAYLTFNLIARKTRKKIISWIFDLTAVMLIILCSRKGILISYVAILVVFLIKTHNKMNASKFMKQVFVAFVTLIILVVLFKIFPAATEKIHTYFLKVADAIGGLIGIQGGVYNSGAIRNSMFSNAWNDYSSNFNILNYLFGRGYGYFVGDFPILVAFMDFGLFIGGLYLSSRSLYRSDYSNKRQIIPAPICRTTEII